MNLDNLTFQDSRHLARTFPEIFNLRISIQDAVKSWSAKRLFWDLREMQYGEEMVIAKNYQFYMGECKIRLDNNLCGSWLNMDAVKPHNFTGECNE